MIIFSAGAAIWFVLVVGGAHVVWWVYNALPHVRARHESIERRVDALSDKLQNDYAEAWESAREKKS